MRSNATWLYARPPRLPMLLILGVLVVATGVYVFFLRGDSEERWLTAQLPRGSAGMLLLTSDATRLTIQISGLPKGTHASHVHHGDSCSTPGEIDVVLTELVAEPNKRVYQPTLIGIPRFDHFLDDKHVVDIHEGPDADAGLVLACALFRRGYIEG